MSLDIARLHSPNGQTVGKTMPWRLNQELLATVVSSKSGGTLQVQIEGKSYSFQSNTAAEPGQQLTLKVVSLTPQIELQFVDTSRQQRKPETSPATILSAQLLQKALHLENKSISNLLNFISSFSLAGLRSLPVETVSLLNILKKKLTKPKDLADPARLKSALKNSGLLMESKQASPQPAKSPAILATDMKAILLQIFRSLDNKQSGMRGKTPATSGYAYGLSAYKITLEKSGMLDTGLKQRLEEALSSITLKQSNTLDEMSKGNQRWFFELLVNFPSRPVSIAVTIYRDSREGSESYNASRWGAEFSLELENSGFISAQINIVESSVAVSLHSELSETAQFLGQHCDILRDKLNSCGLTLSAFHSEQLHAGQS